MKRIAALKTILAGASLTVSATSCGGVKSFMAVDSLDDRSKLIANPFGDLYQSPSFEQSAPVVVRSKKGDRAVEVEIPARNSEVSEWVVPVSPQGRSAASGEAEARTQTNDYGTRRPSSVDREIQRNMPASPAEDVAARRDLESEMGLQAVEEDLPRGDRSYLGALDRVKNLFRERRHEAALLEVEEMMREYPTDPKLHAMRGTLLDRLGYSDLARQSWAQSLKLDPSNEPLPRFLERRGERAPASAMSAGGKSP